MAVKQGGRGNGFRPLRIDRAGMRERGLSLRHSPEVPAVRSVAELWRARHRDAACTPNCFSNAGNAFSCRGADGKERNAARLERAEQLRDAALDLGQVHLVQHNDLWPRRQARDRRASARD